MMLKVWKECRGLLGRSGEEVVFMNSRIRKLSRSVLATLAVASSVVLGIPSASAQSTYFWSGNASTAGGNGTWDTTLTNWSATGANGTFTLQWSNASNDTAVFGSTAGTVTLGTPITAGGLTFNTTGYVVTGSTLTLAGASAPIISVSAGTSTISSDIAGTNGLEKTGGSTTLILSGTNNTYSGTTTISAGILQGNKSTPAGASPFGTSTIQLNAGTQLNSITISANDTPETYIFGNDVNVGGSATIDFRRSGGVGSAKTHAYGNLTIGNSTLSLTAANINHTLSFTGGTLTGNAIINNGTNATTNIGAITETGGPRTLTKQGVATLRLTGTNTYTGTTTISAGVLEVQGSIASSSGIINNSALTFNSGSAQSYGNVISGSGSLTKLGVGTATLSGNNTFSGNVTVSASGTLVLSGINSYTGATNIGGGSSGGPGTLSVNSVSDYGVASAIGAALSGAINFNPNANNFGTLIYTGSGGSMNRQFSIGTSGDSTVRNGAINNNGSGALILTASQFNVTITGTTVTRTLSLGGTYTGSANEIQGVIQNNAAGGVINLTKNGASTWKLSGANTYTGATSISANGGTLQFGKASSLYNGNNASWTAANIRVANGGTLAFNVGGTDEFTTTDVGTLFTNLANSSNPTTNGMAAGSRFGFDTSNASGGSFEISQVIANSGGTSGGSRGLTKLGTGTLVLSNTNTYNGSTNVNAGTLLVSGSGSINSTSAINIAAGARFANSSSVALALAPTLSGNGTGQRAVYGGTGTLNAALTLDNVGDVLSPGNSPGIQTFGVNQSWASNSYDWELNDWTAQVAGTNIDQINITGNLTLTGAAPGSYILNVLSLTSGNVTGNVPNFSETNNSWTILTTTTGITGFDASYWTINTGNFTSTPTATGTWSIAQSGNNLILNYVAVPEPATIALLASGVAIVGYIRARRRRG